MKITKLTTYIVPPRWLFLKVETDEGIVGWGEPVVEGRALTVQAAVHELEDYLIGKDPFLIEDHWTVMYRGGFYRGGAVHMSAISGIDQALWDIKGKALGQPIHSLLGGQLRDRIKVYSWIGGDRPSDVANNAKEVVARGFKAIKLNGCEEMQIVDTNEKVERRSRPSPPSARRSARISASASISMGACTSRWRRFSPRNSIPTS